MALRVAGAGRRTIRAAKGGEGAVGTSRTRARILGLVVLLAPLAAAPAQAQGGFIMQELDRRQDQLIQEMRERQRRGDDRTDERRLIERREADRADERRRDALREIERREQIDADQRRERRP